MDFVKKTLGPDEQYIYRAKFNWTYDFVGCFWLVLGCIPLFFWMYLLLSDSFAPLDLGRSFAVTSAVAVAAGALVWLSRAIQKWTTVIAVTSARVIIKIGVVSRQSRDLSLLTIEKVDVRQTFWGRVCNFGTLVIRGTGGAMIELPPVDSPLTLRREIRQAKSQLQAKSGLTQREYGESDASL